MTIACCAPTVPRVVAVRRILIGSVLLVAPSCAPLTPPGMVASSGAAHVTGAPPPPDTDLALLVAFPATPCTTTESAVFVDDEGRFLGAVAPGTAATLSIQPESKRLFVVGSFDVVAGPRTWFARYEVPRRSDQGVIVEVVAADGHNCMGRWTGPLSPRPEAVTLALATKAMEGLRQFRVNGSEGRRWFDEHRERVDELVGRAPIEANVPRPVVTQTMQAE